jgi:4-hydroxy-4-methyl-2-oxoglutarate aldolase
MGRRPDLGLAPVGGGVTTAADLASVGEGRVSALLGFEPAWPGARVLGRAFTARGAAGDNLALHHAIAQAARGDVIVLAVGGERGRAHCGGIVATAAKARGIAGLVVDGAIRDRTELEEIGLPVFHLGTSPLKPAKDGPVELGVRVELGGVRIEPGDLVAADADGVVVVPAALADELVAAARLLGVREREVLAQVEAGKTTVEIYGYELP